MKRLLTYLNNSLHTPKWLFILLLAVFILRIPTFFEPYSYGDETIYLTLGNAVREGVPLYKGVHDNKPPLLYLAAALAGNLFWFKAILAIWGIVGIYLFWKLSARIFSKNITAQKISTVVFALFTTIPFYEGNIVNAELFMIVPTILAFLLILNPKANLKIIFLSGILFSISSLFKVPAAFDLPAVIFFWLSRSKLDKKGVQKVAVESTVLLLGFIIPILLVFVWYFFQGAVKEYLIAAYLQNFGYLSSWRPQTKSESFLIRNMPLLSRAGIVTLINLFLFLKRKSLSKEFILVTSWLTFSLFAVTLSERPYPHYLIQAVAPFSFLLAMLFTFQNTLQTLAILPLAVFAIIPVYYKFWHYGSAAYYGHFISFASGKTSKDVYLSGFGGGVVRNYNIAKFIDSYTKESDKVFVWEDSAQIYALSKRLPPTKYVAGYHIKDFYFPDMLVKDLSANMPKLIIVLPDSNPPKELVSFIKGNYLLIEKIEEGEVWSLMGISVRGLIAPQ
jgi:hypothetical protein